jgi:hypothetical protein
MYVLCRTTYIRPFQVWVNGLLWLYYHKKIKWKKNKKEVSPMVARIFTRFRRREFFFFYLFISIFFSKTKALTYDLFIHLFIY